MPGKNHEHVQVIAEIIFSTNHENILNEIIVGTFNLNAFVESQEDTIRKEILENWDSIVGTGNPYWERDNITESDLKFLIGRLKHDLCSKLPELIKSSLKEKYQGWQLQYVETLTKIKDLMVSLCQRANVGPPWELVEFQSLALSLQRIATNIEKVRLFFTAQQLKIEPVAIPKVALPSEFDAKSIQPKYDCICGLSENAASISDFKSPSLFKLPSDNVVTAHSLAGKQGAHSTSLDEEEICEIGSNHIFERSLVNGFVNTVKYKPALVPEKHVREKGFEHGDRVRVVNVRPVGDRMHYEFELVEKANLHYTNRVQINMCIVEQDEDGLFVERTANGQPIFVVDENDQKVFLKEHDISRLKLISGDIVDIAFRPNDPKNARVVWKHYT